MQQIIPGQFLLKRLALSSAGLLLIFSAAAAADLSPVIQTLPGESAALRAAEQASFHAAYRRWEVSLVPVLASQALDTASSYGMRELNPALAGPDGRFGARAAGIKLGAAGALLGIEYLIVGSHPGAARVFSKINWAASLVTVGFAVHNVSIR